MPSLGPKREAVIHFNLHKALSNVLGRFPKFDGVEFQRTEPEFPISGVGEANLVLFDRKNVAWLTIETKAATKAGDPFSDKVIGQALKYAAALGSYYFATCDGRTFVLFDNKEKGVPFWERKRLPPYDLVGKDLEAFSERLRLRSKDVRDSIRVYGLCQGRVEDVPWGKPEELEDAPPERGLRAVLGVRLPRRRPDRRGGRTQRASRTPGPSRGTGSSGPP